LRGHAQAPALWGAVGGDEPAQTEFVSHYAAAL
jgi:hypothetical protein